MNDLLNTVFIVTFLNQQNFIATCFAAEFEGLADMSASGNASADDDMSDLFRSFLVDGDDILTSGGGSHGSHSVGSGGHHSGGSQPNGAPGVLEQPTGFHLRVGSGGGGCRGGGHDGEAVAPSLMRRRPHTASPELDDTESGSQV